MGKRRNYNLHWLWLSSVLIALGILSLILSATSTEASLNLQVGSSKALLVTETPSPTQTISPSMTDTPADTLTPTPSPTLETTATVQPTNTPYPTRTLLPTSTTCPIQFTDVPPGSTFYDYVRCLACRGIVSGYPDGTFRPNANITRGQLSKIAVLSGGYQYPIPPDQQTFEDVHIGSTFWWYVEEIALTNIMQGYPCGSNLNEPCVPPSNRPYFRPSASATRAQTAKVIDDVAGWLSPCTAQAFEDVPLGAWYYCHVQHLYEHGAVNGYACGGPSEPCVPPTNRPYFRPNNLITRGQLAKMASQALFIDCSSAIGQNVNLKTR